jgi:hypothetical protein
MIGTIQEPQRGQPIDLSYISQIVKTVNDIARETIVTGNKTSVVDNPQTGNSQKEVRTADLKIIAGYIEIFSTSNQVAAGDTKDFSYAFPISDFQYPPIVVATPVNILGTDAGKNVSVILRESTTSKVEGTVKFGANGNLAIGVNLIAIGVASS